MNVLSDTEFGRQLGAEWPVLLRYGRHVFSRMSRPDIEDLVQKTMLRAWTHRHSYVPQGTGIRCWLFTILRHEGLSHIRHLKVESRSYESMVVLFSRVSDPDDMLEAKRAMEAMSSLSLIHREAIANSALGYTLNERRSLELDTPGFGALKTRTRRGRQLLRKALGEEVVVT